MAQFRETVYLESAPAVDAERGVLSRVKLLGMESRNQRRYTPAAMKEAAKLYKNKKIYVNHPLRADLESGSDRKLQDWAGTIQNAKFESDGIYGDVKLRKESEHFKGILEAAQEFPTDVGFSHVADGESKYEGDTEIVESIKSVFSVDLVTDPATTAGFFESKRGGKKTLKSQIESLPESNARAKLVKLVEMMDASYLDGGAPMEADDATSKDPMASLAKELIRMLGETLKALASKSDAPPPVPATDPFAPDPAEDDDMPEEDPKKDAEKKAAFESLKTERDKALAENAELKARTLLLESNREATDIRVKALARETDEAARKELLESWPVLESEGGARPERSPALLESERDTSYDFSDPEKFAARYR